jgi:hypothetical protein
MKKLSKSIKDEIKMMSESNTFYWYECSGNHRFRSWFMEGRIKAYCPEGHQMRKENTTSSYKIYNDVIAWYEDL